MLVFVCTSIEGRVSVDWVDLSKSFQNQKYAFKCHREISKEQANSECVYPVHCATFLPSGDIFATGGGDGFVNFWDINAKRRQKQFGRFPTSISSISISSDSTLLAVASSYCFEEGEKEYFCSIFLVTLQTRFI